MRPFRVLFPCVNRPKWEHIFTERGDLGCLLSPTSWRKPWTGVYALDNDAFAHSHKLGWWEGTGEAKWLKMLDKIPADHPPLFCLLPDVVGDWLGTLARGKRYLPGLRGRGLPVALALQDGCVFSEALDLAPDWVFVGGSTEWKWGHVDAICEYFKPLGVAVHVGRVNTRRKIFSSRAAGADSCDGTGWAKWSDRELPLLCRALDQTLLWEGVYA